MYIQSSRLRGRLLHYVEFFLFYVSQVALQATSRLRLVPMHLYWSLAWSLVSALLYIVHAILCIHFSIHMGCDPASDWSLVIEFHVVLLVACVVTYVVRGLLEKLSWESQIQLHQATEQAPGRLLYF